MPSVESLVPIVAFLLMTAVGLDVTRSDLRRIAAGWPGVAVATAAQSILLPAAALLIVRALDSPTHAEFVLLLAACPGGGMSNVYVYLARANTALSVTLTALSCLLAVTTMPVAIAAYAAVLGRDLPFALPVPTLLGQLLVMAVIPVTLGALVRDRWPALEARYGGILRGLSAVGVTTIVVMGMRDSAGQIDRPMLRAAAAGAALVPAGMLGGWILGLAFRRPRADRFTLLVEFAVRNLAIAMVIEVTLLGHTSFVPFGALVLLAQAAVLMAAVQVYRRIGRVSAPARVDPAETLRGPSAADRRSARR